MTLEDLGRRAVACKHWRWMDGMLIQPLNSRTAVIEEEYIHDRGWSAKRRKWDDLHPDLSDPATLGCLLALVRRAWNGNVAPVYPNSKEALTNLVAALEAAP